MLNTRADQVHRLAATLGTQATHQPEYGEVVRLGRTGGEYDFARRRSDQRRNRRTCLLRCGTRLHTVGMAGAGVAEKTTAQPRCHGCGDARIKRRRGCAIKVQWLTQESPPCGVRRVLLCSPARRRRCSMAVRKPRRMLASLISSSARCRKRRIRAIRLVPL